MAIDHNNRGCQDKIDETPKAPPLPKGNNKHNAHNGQPPLFRRLLLESPAQLV